MNKIVERIEKKIGSPGTVEKLADRLSNSEINNF